MLTDDVWTDLFNRTCILCLAVKKNLFNKAFPVKILDTSDIKNTLGLMRRVRAQVIGNGMTLVLIKG